MGIKIEDLSHIIIKLSRIRGSMHTDDGTREVICIGLNLRFHEIEIQEQDGR